MNYTLSSTRKIGAYHQKIITTHLNADKATSSTYLNTLKAWHTLLAGLDAQDREVGTINYKGFTEGVSEQTGNTGLLADGLVTVISTASGKPKTTAFRFADCTAANLTTTLDNTYLALTGNHINAQTSYITSVIITLH